MKKQLAKPENWQDFESLCKKLWGEIWNCPEIKKNGRSGQNQSGVDIYGIPNGYDQQHGIQCKLKDDYAKSTLTEKEIDKEVKNALGFSPPLQKLYIATTANKNSKIEEYVRKKDLESRKLGFFEIHLFCWEDIVDLIETNKETHDYYLNNIKFKTNTQIQVKFDNGSNILEFTPKLIKNIVDYRFEKLPLPGPLIGLGGLRTPQSQQSSNLNSEFTTTPQPFKYQYDFSVYENLSTCVFRLKITNIGNQPLRNYKLRFQFIDGDFITDTVTKNTSLADFNRYEYNTHISENARAGEFDPTSEILVQKDSIISDEICLRPNNGSQMKIKLKWQLVSEGFDTEGSLMIILNTDVAEMQTTITDEPFKSDEEIYFENVWNRIK